MLFPSDDLWLLLMLYNSVTHATTLLEEKSLLPIILFTICMLPLCGQILVFNDDHRVSILMLQIDGF